MHATRFSYYSTGARRYPLSYVYSGLYYWGNGGLFHQNSNGRWWSTTAYSDSGAYYLYMDSSGLHPQSNINKANGLALRCVSYSTSTRRYPLSYVYSGVFYWSDSKLYNQNSYGVLWSTTTNNAGTAYGLAVGGGDLRPQYIDTKYAGSALHWHSGENIHKAYCQ